MQNQDYRAGQGAPVQQQVYVDPATNCLFTIDPVTGQYLWLIDPTTGQPMVNPAAPQQHQPVYDQRADEQPIYETPASELPVYEQLQSLAPAEAQPMPEPSLPSTPQPEAALFESGAATMGQPVMNVSDLSHAPSNPAFPEGAVDLADLSVKKSRGKGGLVIGMLLAIVAMAVVVALLFVVPALSSGTSASQPAQPSTAQGQGSQQAAQTEQSGMASQVQADPNSLAIGQAATVEEGLIITLNSVETTLTNYDGSPMTCINVTYQNVGDKEEQYNVFDWKAQDKQGVLRSFSFYSKATDDLNSGTLSPGESVSGNVYFDGNELVQVYYFRSIVETESEVVWSIL